MASYFKLTATEGLQYLPNDVRCRLDLNFLATEAEAELIAHYTREELDTRATATPKVLVTGNENLSTSATDPVVYLRYYKEDADELVSTDEVKFKTAMRRAIAALIRVRASQMDVDPLVKSETRGRRSVTYFAGANQLGGNIPRAATRWLKPYDKRPVSYAI